MSALVPQKLGTLESTSFGRLLVNVLDERGTGTLILKEPNGPRHGIFFEAGHPSRARLAAPCDRLGDVLVETGALSGELSRQTLERALAEQILHGQLLLNEGLITRKELDQGLREQLARRVAWLFGQPVETRFGYFEGRNFLEHWGAPLATRPHGLELLWRGLRERARAHEIEATLESVVDRKLTLLSELPAGHFDFMGEERGIIERLRARPQPLTELVESTPALERAIRRVVCFLVLTRSIRLQADTPPPVGLGGVAPVRIPPLGRVPSIPSEPSLPLTTAPASVPPPERHPPSGFMPPISPRSATLREEARQRLERTAHGHYEVLGLRKNSSLAEIQTAFFRLSKRWHPDRLGADESALRDSATTILTSITEAYRVLSDPEARRAYDAASQHSQPDASDHEELARALGAELAFQRAEAFLARGNLTAARREAKLALSTDPTRGEHIALDAWLSALLPGTDQRRILVALTQARKAAENSPKVHYYAGRVLQQLGRHKSALNEFRLVVEREPRNIDAAREVRIYEQRLRHSRSNPPSLAPEAPAPDSSLSRWLKRR